MDDGKQTNLQQHAGGLLLAAILLIGLGGCGSSATFERASGQVQLPEESLSAGLITWIPIEGTRGKKVSASVISGTWEIGPEKGLVPGRYRIEIFAVPTEIQAIGRGTNPHSIAADSEPFRDIAPEFNVNSTLVREIKAGDTNVYDFEVVRAGQ